MRTRLLYILGVGGFWAALGCAQQTSCPLATAKGGDTVTLRGEVFPTAHDTFIRPVGCEERVILVYGDDPSLGKSKIPMKRDEAFQRYETYLGAEQKPSGITDCKECWKYRVTAEFQGRLDIAESAGWKKDPKSGKVIGIEGFGHPLPFTRYRLVVTSVSKVEAAERTFAPAPRVDLQHEMQHAGVADGPGKKP
jgi:hypothetical protein